jgi:hypothetical protein
MRGGRREKKRVPFILFSDIVLFTEIDEIGHRFGSEKLQTVYHIYLIEEKGSADEASKD